MFDENEYFLQLRSLKSKLPQRDDGRIDYTHATKAAVITIFVQCNEDILLLKRSNKVLTYKGKWNTVTGYLDEIVPIKKKISEELQEELHLSSQNIKNIHIGRLYTFHDISIEKTWIIYPVKVILEKKPEIILDREHVEYRWVNPRDLDQYETVPNLSKSFTQLFLL